MLTIFGDSLRFIDDFIAAGFGKHIPSHPWKVDLGWNRGSAGTMRGRGIRNIQCLGVFLWWSFETVGYRGLWFTIFGAYIGISHRGPTLDRGTSNYPLIFWWFWWMFFEHRKCWTKHTNNSIPSVQLPFLYFGVMAWTSQICCPWNYKETPPQL